MGNIEKLCDEIENSIVINRGLQTAVNGTIKKRIVLEWEPELIMKLIEVEGQLSASKHMVSIICRKLTNHVLNKDNNVD